MKKTLQAVRSSWASAALLLAALTLGAGDTRADWCEAATAGPDGIPGTSDDLPECVRAAGVDDRTECGRIWTELWVFDQQDGCLDCPRSLYLPVQCPGPVRFMLASYTAEVRVTALEGGLETPLPLVIRNECALRLEAGDPLVYCDACGTMQDRLARKDRADLALDKPAGTCLSGVAGALAELPCLPVRVEGLTGSWGPPLDDSNPDADGSGFLESDEMSAPPCDHCTQPACPCGQTFRRNRVVQGQYFDVLVQDVPAPTVLRIDIRNGDDFWLVGAGCGAAGRIGFSIYGDLDEAEAALADSPAPRLLLHEDPEQAFSIVSEADCPDSVQARVTICNTGNAAAGSAPFWIEHPTLGLVLEGDQTAHPTDPACTGPLLPGECRSCVWEFPHAPSPLQEATRLILDPADVLTECDESAGGPSSCDEPRRGAGVFPCEGPPCGAVARVGLGSSAVCLGETVRADAGPSSTGSCAGTTLYTFEAADGSVIPGGEPGPDPLRDLTPAAAGDIGLRLRTTCDSDPLCTAISPLQPLRVGPLEPLDFPSSLTVVPEGECALRVSWDAPLSGDAPVAFDVYRSATLPVPLDPSSLVATGLSETSFLDAGWNGAVAYRVVAVAACEALPNGGGDSAPATPVDTVAPEFGGVTDTRDLGFCQVEVQWDESTATDACSGVASYNVYRDHGVGHAGDTLVATGVSGSPHVDTTPGNGTWVYVVRAVDAAGNEEQNEVFQQESENSCTNDFPQDAGMDDENGIDPPNADSSAGLPRPGGGGPVVLGLQRRDGAGDMTIRWSPSPDEGGLYLVTYSVLRGTLAALSAGRYDHELAAPEACGITGNQATLSGQAGGSHYYLVAAVAGDNATFGYDWTGIERPAAEACYLP